MSGFKATEYKVRCISCNFEIDDSAYPLECPNCTEPGFLRADYAKKQLNPGDESLGLYRFADWLPVKHMLKGSGAPITYKSEGLAQKLGLNNLWITFNGWWPEKGAVMKTGTFKECEAFSVLGRMGDDFTDVLVVASAGNTARAFARVCSENNIPLLLVVPRDNIGTLWFDSPINDNVKLICPDSGSDYFDAIVLSQLASNVEGYSPEGGAKNIARRDGMATTMLSAATTMKEIPEFYFQAVGSGTGAIAAWEANLRLIEDGRFGNRKSKLMVSQNIPFLPIYDSWQKRSPELVDLKPEDARSWAEAIDAKVLSNRKPPYSLKGGLYDALVDTDGEVLKVDNTEATRAAKLFHELEGIDISPAAAVSVASLIHDVEDKKIAAHQSVMLNITGGGMERFKAEHKLYYLEPSMIFPKESHPSEVEKKLKGLF
ncbi:MAG: cysteate synthase [Spirochaetaceae bacterium]|jgi:cysteate synthase|nr:cysteate synthase [Spirochaetaceae bacterium]